jgi:hypothetical protein
MTGTSKIRIAIGFLFGALTGHLVTRFGILSGEHAPSPTLIEPASPTLDFSKKIVVPMVDFEQTSLDEAVDYLRSMSRTGMEISDAPPPYRLNFIVDDPKHAARPINLRMKSVRLDQLCERIAQAAGVRVTFEPDAIVFSARDPRVEQAGSSNGG